MTTQKDTSWYVTPPTANKCSARRSTTRNTSPGSYLLNSRTIISSKTIPNPPKKLATTNRTNHSGNNLSNWLLAIGYWKKYWRMYMSSVFFVCSSPLLLSFLSLFYILTLLYFPTLSTSSLYLFLKINLYYNHPKRYKLPSNYLIINTYPSSACIFSPLACIFF